MQNDLISRQAVAEFMFDNRYCTSINDALRQLKVIQTAYDPDKVVEQLEEQRKEYTELTKTPSMELPQESYYSGLVRGFELSQDIVRNGGKE